MARACLALEDGRVFEGRAFGAPGTLSAEIVFNTSMTGYLEILTDPSYFEQIVTFTTPMIGNYGVQPADGEADRPMAAGLIVRELSRHPSNHRSVETLDAYCSRHGIVGIEHVDTRALTRHIRCEGAMMGALSTVNPDPDALVKMAREAPGMAGRDLASEVMCSERYEWTESLPEEFPPPTSREGEGLHILVVDFGVKRSILRQLVHQGCRVTVVPGNWSAERILNEKPDGVLLSNGPGDPAACTDAVDMIRSLIGAVPIFGICLGHQLLGLAFGATTYKMRFGHRGGNQPVRDEETGRIGITAQNHGFAIELDSLPDELRPTHIHLNDGTLAGFRHRELPIMAVQFHPEAGPGPNDMTNLFPVFMRRIRTRSREAQPAGE